MAEDASSLPVVLSGERPRTTVPVRPSTVTLPERSPAGVRTVLDFFLLRFPTIPPATWVERFDAGKVWAAGEGIDTATPYRPLLEVHYRREVESEPPVREDFQIVWADRHLLVVDKPPDLPVTPGGHWVRGCLLHLLLETTGNDRIAPLHRLDRLTSGLVLLSLDPATRRHYACLFQPRALVEKVYTAVCERRQDLRATSFTLDHHVTRSSREHWRQVVRPEMPANARSEVEVLAFRDRLVLLQVRPLTGRKHQIRVQLAEAGLPILGDPLYGTGQSGSLQGTQRMWLDANRLTIKDFRRPEGDLLSASWSSSRAPAELLRRAVCRQHDRQNRGEGHRFGPPCP
jgi:tRNA pseudouridine32 synthase/23S rRNA pseudouridine746 synthase